MSEPPPEREVTRLREQVERLIRLATARAEAGEDRIAQKLAEVATEIELKARHLRAPPARQVDADLLQAEELRLRAEELHAVAAALNNTEAREGLLRAAQSCERVAASLELLAGKLR